MPYHSLSQTERETFNSRKQMLEHLGSVLRAKAVEQDRSTWEDEEGRRSELLPFLCRVDNVMMRFRNIDRACRK